MIMDTVELSRKSLHGVSSPKTMKVQGVIKGRSVIVLLDCGATQNFISITLVSELKLSQLLTSSYGIIIRTCDEVQGQGLCKAVSIDLPELTIIEDFLPLELEGGHHIEDAMAAMRFEVDRKMIAIKGDPALTRAELSLKMMTQTWEAED